LRIDCSKSEQVVLALEVEIDGSGRDARDPRHVSDLGLEKAVLREDLGGGPEDQVALVAAGRRVANDRKAPGCRAGSHGIVPAIGLGEGG
jgi:hypothetical protein